MNAAGSLIRHIAVSPLGSEIFATGEFLEKVSLWSILKRKKLADIRTVLDFGGRRLAMVQKSGWSMCVAANYQGPLNGYDFEGNIIWSQEEVTGVQELTQMHSDGEPVIGVGADNQPYRILSALDGRYIAQLDRIIKVYVNCENSNLIAVDSKSVSYLDSWNSAPTWKQPVRSFAVLAASLSPTQVVYTEAAGMMYCFDLNGKLCWVLKPEKEYHFIRVSWNQIMEKWVAIVWNYQKGGSKKLLCIDNNGNCAAVGDIGAAAELEFCCKGTLLISSDGNVLDSNSGALVWNFLNSI